MLRGTIDYFCFITVLSLSVNEVPERVYRSSSETSFLDISNVFSGVLLDFEVAEAEGVSIHRSFDATVLHKLTLPARDFQLGPVFQAHSGLAAVLYSQREIQLWEITAAEAHMTWTAKTDHDIAGIEYIIPLDPPELVYWMSSGGKWDVHCINLAQNPPADLSVLSSEPSSTQLIVCSNAPKLAFVHADTVSVYSLVFPGVRRSPSLQFPYGRVLEVSCFDSLLLLTADGIFQERSLSLPLSTLQDFVGEDMRLGRTEEWMLVSRKGLISLPTNTLFLYLPYVTHGLVFRKDHALFLATHGDQQFAVMAFVDNNVWTSIVAPLPLPAQVSKVQCAETKAYQPISRTVIAISTGNEVWVYKLDYLPKVFVEIQPKSYSFSFDLCAFDYNQGKECTKVEVVVPPADAIVKSRNPLFSRTLHLTCHVPNVPSTCRYDLSDLFLYEHSRFISNHSYLTISTPPALEAFEYHFPSAKVLCFRQMADSFYALLETAGEFSLHSTKHDSACLVPLPVRVGSCCLLSAAVLILLENGQVHSMSLQCRNLVEVINNATELTCSNDRALGYTEDAVTVFDNHAQGLILPTCKPVVDVFIGRSELFTLEGSEVSVYTLTSNEFAFFAKFAVDSLPTAIAYAHGRLVTYDSAGVLSVYFINTLRKASLQYQLTLQPLCTFVRFAMSASELLAICTEKILQLHPTSSALNCVGQEIAISAGALVDTANRVAILVQKEDLYELLVWQTHPHPLLIVSLPATVQLNDTISTDLTVINAEGEQKVPLVLTVANDGAFISVNETWKAVSIPQNEEMSVPLWTLFRGNLLKFSISSTAPIEDMRLTPPCRAAYSVPINCPFRRQLTVSINAEIVICSTFQTLVLFFIQCKSPDCAILGKEEITAADLAIDVIASADLLLAEKSTVLLLLTASTEVARLWHECETTVVHYGLEERRILKVVHSSQRTEGSKNHHFVKVTDEVYHLFVFGALFEHFIMTKAASGDLQFEERQYPRLRLVNIASISSAREAQGVRIYVLTAEQEIRVFALNSTLTLSARFRIRPMLAVPQPRDLTLYKDTVIHVSEASISVYDVSTLRLVKEIPLSQSISQYHHMNRFVSVPEVDISIFLLYQSVDSCIVMDIHAPPHSSQLCEIEATVIDLSPSGVIYTANNMLFITELRTPLLNFDRTEHSDTDREITITAENSNGEVANVTLFVMRTAGKDNGMLELVAVGLICAIGLCIMGRKGRTGRSAEIELESRSFRYENS